MSQPHVVVVGSCNLDHFLEVAQFPASGMTVAARASLDEPGGKGLNQALAAARMGAKVTFIGAVGRDDAGTRIRTLLTQEGIATALLRVAGTSSGSATVVVDDSRENRIVLVAGANASMLALTGDDEAAIRSADLLMVQLELPMAIVLAAAAVAHEAGVPVALTPAPVQPLPAGLLAHTALLLANQHEVRELTGESRSESAIQVLLDRLPAVLVTLGAGGSRYADRAGRSFTAPALKVHSVDTTGAGDVYAGTFVVERLLGEAVDVAMSRASAAAAIATTRRGTSSAIPRRREVLEHERSRRRGTVDQES